MQTESDLEHTKAFLKRYPSLLLLLVEGVDHLCHAFPESQEFSLEFEVDPELPNWQYLAVRIHTSLPSDQAHARLEAFDEAWLLDHTEQIGDKLLFTLECV